MSNFDPTVNKDCQICNVENNVVHFFTSCTLVKRFWILVNEWLSTLENVNTPLSVANIIFGIHSITSFNVNFVILHAKWFIYCNRESNNNVNFDHFMKYLKNVIEIEKHIAVSNGTLRNYSKTLENLLQN